ncbi:hypothetical protein Terro_0472 [Terriglobus roseus DSM 18391]|uniref:Uncharacterized protein n=1 Tax=Terriglobus roseus (strain DSM 18391 / NRRL B-41598 / KBS 63) TaxID=926566 RepID=I3ZC46_TERRK|nr:hypothetical protein [Terriglobus roseus]AFL86814.1 hypothetical protein Terro_0472 [Terriglobus roseus DSM 18391]
MSVPQQTRLAASPSAPAEGTADHKSESLGPPAAPVWLQRLSLLVLVIFCLYLGLLIAVLPWWKDMWDRNALLLEYPALRAFLTRGPVRGLISGLGVLDLWIGISELIHYRDYRN